MNEPELKYHFSEEVQARSKKIVMAACYAMPIISGVIVFGAPSLNQLDLSMKIIVFCLTIVSALFAAWLAYKLSVVNRNETYVVINGTSLIWHGSFGERTVLFSEIKRIELKRDKIGKITVFKLKHSKGLMDLSTYEHLDDLYGKLTIAGVPKPGIIVSDETSKSRKYLMSPLFIFGSMVIMSLLFVWWQKANISSFNVVNHLVTIIVGCYWVIYKPISKAKGDSLKIVDYLLGLIMIASGLLS